MAGKRASAIRACSAISDQLSSKKRKRSASKKVSAPKRTKKASSGKRKSGAKRGSGSKKRSGSKRSSSAGKKKKSAAKKVSSAKKKANRARKQVGPVKNLKGGCIVKLSDDLEMIEADEVSLLYFPDKSDWEFAGKYGSGVLSGAPLFKLSEEEHAALMRHTGGKKLKGAVLLHWPKIGASAIRVPARDGYYASSNLHVTGGMVTLILRGDSGDLNSAGLLNVDRAMQNAHFGGGKIVGSKKGFIGAPGRYIFDARAK